MYYKYDESNIYMSYSIHYIALKTENNPGRNAE